MAPEYLRQTTEGSLLRPDSGLASHVNSESSVELPAGINANPVPDQADDPGAVPGASVVLARSHGHARGMFV